MNLARAVLRAAVREADVNMLAHADRKTWGAWTVRIPAILGGLVAAALGSFGYFLNAFGIGSSCTDHFSCVNGNCAPCTAAHNWVVAGGIGEWVMVIAAGVLLVLGVRQLYLRRTISLVSAAILPLAIAWYYICTVLAEHSF